MQEDCYLFVIKDGNLNGKLFSEIVGDICRASNIGKDLAISKLNEFFDWSTGYIDSREWEVAPDQGYIQDFVCVTYDLEGYRVLPLHIECDAYEIILALEEV